MTIQASYTPAVFHGTGSTGPFNFTFRFFDNADITVYRTAVAGTILPLAESTDYTLTGAGAYAGGSVTLVSALLSGETLTVYRELSLTQLTSIRNLGAFYPEIHEDVFDRITMILQQLEEEIGRCWGSAPASGLDFNATMATLIADAGVASSAATAASASAAAAAASAVDAAESAEDAAEVVVGFAPIDNPTFTTKITTPQIKFPATAVPSSDANTLDDYEEGTWTPSLVCGTSGTITIASPTGVGNYTKIGRQVHICVAFAVESVSSPLGVLTLRGFPGIAICPYSASVDGNNLTSGATTALQAHGLTGDPPSIKITRFSAGSEVDAASRIQANTVLYISATYFV